MLKIKCQPFVSQLRKIKDNKEKYRNRQKKVRQLTLGGCKNLHFFNKKNIKINK
jgi:hypothetical protein